MIIDEWRWLGVFHSEDANSWTNQPDNLVVEPGKGEDDQVKGGHPAMVVSSGRAYLFSLSIISGLTSAATPPKVMAI